MRPTRVTQTTVGSSTPIVLDTYGRAQSSVQVVVAGTVNYTVQQTSDNLFDSTISPTWFDFPDPNLVAATTSQISSVNQPPMALKLVVNSVSGGSATLTVLSSATN